MLGGSSVALVSCSAGTEGSVFAAVAELGTELPLELLPLALLVADVVVLLAHVWGLSAVGWGSRLKRDLVVLEQQQRRSRRHFPRRVTDPVALRAGTATDRLMRLLHPLLRHPDHSRIDSTGLQPIHVVTDAREALASKTDHVVHADHFPMCPNQSKSGSTPSETESPLVSSTI